MSTDYFIDLNVNVLGLKFALQSFKPNETK